jgi:hypothetical protein
MLEIDYQIMISKLLMINTINPLDGIEYSNIITNRSKKWSPLVVEQTKDKIVKLYNNRI